MQRNTDKKTLLHCQVNARATAFSFLYRVLFEGVPVEEAKADMNTVWQPNEVWRDFIFEVMAENDRDPNCETCDWTPPPPGSVLSTAPNMIKGLHHNAIVAGIRKRRASSMKSFLACLLCRLLK